MIRRRVLARQLRLLREQSGLTLEQAAPKLDFSVSKLSRIENAQVVIDVHWVKSMLDVYDVGGARWNELLDLAREAQQPGWWRAYGLGNNSYIAFETEASQVQVFTVSLRSRPAADRRLRPGPDARGAGAAHATSSWTTRSRRGCTASSG